MALALDLGRQTLRKVRRQDLALVSAGLTFYAALTIVPLALFGLYGAGLLLGPDRVVTILDGIAVYLDGPLGLDQAIREAARITPGLGLTSLAASIATASAYGEGLLRAVETYEPGRPKGGTAWRGRLLVIPYVLAFPFLVAVALLAAGTVDGPLGRGLGAQVLGLYVAFVLSWLLLSVQLLFVYRAFAPRAPSLGALLWGACTAASFLAGMSLGWLPVLRLGVDVGQAYGGSETLGRLVLVAIYLLLFQLVMVVGQLLVGVIDDHRRTV